MVPPSLSGIAPLQTLSLYIQATTTAHNEAEEATAMTHAGWRRHVAMAHDEAALRGYDA
jgi:hypothetical protein